MMAMSLCCLRITVICACRMFLGWLLMSMTTADSFRLLMISTHLPDDLTITICSSSKPIPFDLTLPLMMLLTSLLTRLWLLMVLLENIPEQESRPKRENQSLLNGPQVDTSKAGVVASQDQVDDLLDSLGF